ncbi:MAG: hypothetical protein KTV72_04520 [Wolbachia endosymbiont of Melophagus ovinus]|nr:hypothetical protein [Wolbachia endosymbiont of Melophagus ovinus]
MAEVKNTSQENVEKKFKDVFGRSPGAFPEGTSLEDKVNYITERTEALKAMKSKELESKMENIAKLNKEFEKRQRQNDKEIDKLRRSTQELKEEFGTSRKSRFGGSDKSPQEARQDTQIAEASVQTDTRLSVNAEAQALSESKSQAVDLSSMSRSPIREKSSDKKPGLNKENNVPQENQKEEGLFSLLKRFVKKILEKLLGEDEKSVENAHNMKGATQRDNEVQQQSKHFDNILSQDRTISKGLEQVATQLENSTITPVNTPEVDKSAGHER